MCNFFRIKVRPRYPHTPRANGLVQNQNKQLGRFIRTSSKQKNIPWSDQTESKTFAHNTQRLSIFYIISTWNGFQRKKQCPNRILFGVTRIQHQICTSQFCKYLPTHCHNTMSDQNTVVQTHLNKPSISYTLQIEKSLHYIFFLKTSLLNKDYSQNQKSTLDLERYIN